MYFELKEEKILTTDCTLPSRSFNFDIFGKLIPATPTAPAVIETPQEVT